MKNSPNIERPYMINLE